MSRTSTPLVAAAAFCLGAAVVFAYLKFESLELWSASESEVRSASSDEIMVMRTRGGLLEVSRINAIEVFDTKFVYSVLGVDVGETAPRIRVPAVYRYQIELAPQWRVLRTDEIFTVVAPAVKPSLPVAVDLARMEKEASGTWVLLPFTADEALDSLERRITAKLANKAVMPAYIQLQREAARRTVAEFVEKWLVTQTQWKSALRPRIRVLFADEPVGSIETLAPAR